MKLWGRDIGARPIWAAIGLASLAAAIAGGSWSHQRVIDLEIRASRRFAAAIAPADLSAARAVELKSRLSRLAGADAEARTLSVFAAEPNSGKTVLIADSRPAGAVGSLSPSLADRDGRPSASLERALRTGEPSAAGAIPADDGAWLVTYAPIPGTADSGRACILASAWRCRGWIAAWFAGALPAGFMAWMALGLPFAYLRLRDHDAVQREAVRNLSEAVEQSPAAVMIVGLNDRVEYANTWLCDELGYSRREMIGRDWRFFQKADTPAEMRAEIASTIRSGRPWHGEWFNRRSDGAVYAVEGHVSPVRNRAGRVVSFVVVSQDLTERKRKEDALRTALERAEAGDRAKSRFFATMSHEVRTPLNGIVGFTSLLAETELPAEAREYVSTIRTSAEALMKLTGEILDYARIETGGLKLAAEPANLRAMVEDTLELFAVAAAEKQIELLHWVDESAPAMIVADEARLRQVLANLVGNAVKFTPRGSVELTVRADTSAPGPARLVFSVRDTGIGIASEHHRHLFKAFSQVDESTTRRYGGSGLGLAISRNLVQLMGGEIDLESREGEGSTFRFTLPLVIAPADLAEPPPSLPERTRLALIAPLGAFRSECERLARRWGASLECLDPADALAGVSADKILVEFTPAAAADAASRPAGVYPWDPDRAFAIVPVTLDSEIRAGLRRHFGHVIAKPLRHEGVLALLAGATARDAAGRRIRKFGLQVLVVEDNSVNQRLVQRLLTSLGCTWSVAGNGRLGLDALRAPGQAFDLVLMDLHMPELDGLAAIEKIRAGDAGEDARNIWITALTADARPEQRARVRAAGANDYLVKPVGLADLAEALQRFAGSAAPV